MGEITPTNIAGEATSWITTGPQDEKNKSKHSKDNLNDPEKETSRHLSVVKGSRQFFLDMVYGRKLPQSHEPVGDD